MAKILIVDDDKEIVSVFSKILSKAGYKVVAALGGKEAIRLAKSEAPQLVLLDISMPEMDGGQVAQELLASNQTKNIPIVFLTSIISEREVIENSGVIGGRSFLSKYSDPAEIVKHIMEKLPPGKAQ
jgi:CheY-like chemotaxis protein